MKKLYEETYIQEIADSIRLGLKIEDTMSISEMPKYIDRLGNPYINTIIDITPSHLDEEGKWIRPEEYEDLSNITWTENEEVCYLSLLKNTNTPWLLGLYITASKGSQVEYGHIVNGEFVSNGTVDLIKSNTAYVKALPADEETLVAKITSQNYLYPITYFSFYNFSAAQAGTSIAVPYYFQPIVERIGNLPYISNTSNSGTARGFGGAMIERDALKFGHFGSVTALNNAYAYCYNLEELDINDLDTSHWKVKNLSNMFLQCAKLKKIDLSNWDTSKWEVTNISSLFNTCVSLVELKINTWDTSNWAVTTLANLFLACQNLEKTGIENWNTSNWAVTSMTYMFQYCVSLKELDLSKWDTSNWAVTTLAYTWDYCLSLKELDIHTWNTSNWAVTSLAYTWECCYSLVKLDLNSWDTSNWAVTTLQYIFGRCENLRHLLIDNWDTSNWAVTTFGYAFSYCGSLLSLPIENWNTSNWAVTSMAGFVSYCHSLVKLDFSKWNTANFALTTLQGFNTICKNLSYMDVSTLSSKTLTTTTNMNPCSNEPNLKLVEYFPPTNFNFNHGYSSMMNLSRDSLIRILNSLPRVTTARTLTLGNLRIKLTTADLAIATEKGWTVA